MEEYKLTVTSSPHFHDRNSTGRIMLDVIIALIPSCIAAVVIFGVKALLLIITCVLTAVIAESLYDRIVKKPNTVKDLSAVVTGILLALNLGTEVRIYEAIVGTVVAIIVVKCLFGGLGCNFANPAITGRVFMLETFASVTTFTNPKGVELVSSATPLVVLNSGDTSALPTLSEMFLGLHGGNRRDMHHRPRNRVALPVTARGHQVVCSAFVHPHGLRTLPREVRKPRIRTL